MIKIIFVINSLAVGGVEKALVNLVNSLDENKYDITVLSITRDFTLKEQLNSNIKLKGIFPKNMKGLDYIFKYISTNILYKLFIKEKYDIEVAYSDGRPVVLLGFNTISKSKKFTWIHQDVKKYDKVINCYTSWDAYKESYKKFHKVFCVSELANQSFIEVSNAANSCVIHNVIPKKELMMKAKEAGDIKKRNHLIFITVGRLSQEKGQLRLLKIHKALIDEGFFYKLWIVGDGPDKDAIMKFIQENQLQDNVELFGYQSNPYKYICQSDLYICPSYTEALSTTCIESLLLGVPVVTTNVPGSQDILGGSNCGSIVKNTDESIYKELKRILLNPGELKALQENMTIPLTKFNDQDIVREMEKVWGV